MALITCPECGKQISDKAECCIGCGYPLKYLKVQENSEVQTDTRTELEKLVDEIYARNDNMVIAIKELRQATGLDLGSAMDLMKKKYTGFTRKEEKEALKRQRRTSMRFTDLNLAKVARCPKCRSISISYQEQGNGKGYAVCLSCGEKWRL